MLRLATYDARRRSPEPGWAAWLAATLLTAQMLAVVGGGIGGARPTTALVAAPPAPPVAEHLVFLPVPAAPTAAVPVDPTAPVATRPATRPALPGTGAATSGITGGFPGAAPRDTTARDAATVVAPGATGPAARAPLPRDVFGAGAPALCLPPCGTRPSVGLGRALPPLTTAQRDSVARAIGDYVVRAPMEKRAPSAGPRQSGIGVPAPSEGMPGVGVSVPLPGGGPSAEQRRAWAKTNADVLARLSRIRTRAESVLYARLLDSLRADSLRRAARRPASGGESRGAAPPA